MIRIETDPLRKFSFDLYAVINDLRITVDRIFNIFTVDALPQLKNSLRNELEHQLGLIRFIHSSDNWKAKRKKIIAGEMKHEGFQRVKGGGKLPIRFAENWKSTGAMETILSNKIRGVEVSVQKNEYGFDAVFPIDISKFVDSDDPDYSDMPYPLAVDAKIREKTGGDMGLFHFDDENRNLIFELFVDELDDFIQRAFSPSGKI